MKTKANISKIIECMSISHISKYILHSNIFFSIKGNTSKIFVGKFCDVAVRKYPTNEVLMCKISSMLLGCFGRYEDERVN